MTCIGERCGLWLKDSYAANFENGYESASAIKLIRSEQWQPRAQHRAERARASPLQCVQLAAGATVSASATACARRGGQRKQRQRERKGAGEGEISGAGVPPRAAVLAAHHSSSNSSTSTRTGMAMPSGLSGNRSSMASLPLPKQMPFRTLPTVQAGARAQQAQSAMQEEPPIER